MDIALRLSLPDEFLALMRSIASSLEALAQARGHAFADLPVASPPKAGPAASGVLDVSSQTAPAVHLVTTPEALSAASSAMNAALAKASQVNAAPPPPKRETPYTPERIKLIERTYAAGDRIRAITDACNQLPGPSVGDGALTMWCSTHGLKRAPVTVPAGPKPTREALGRDPVRGTKEAIFQWGAMRGVGGPFNIDAINRKAEAIGHPGFIVA